MAPTIDFSGAQALDVLPKDVYPATFTEYEMEEGEKGPYAKMVFTISDASEDYAGRKLFRNMSFSPASLWNAKKGLIALGADADELTGSIEVEEVLEALVGNDCRLSVSIKKYEGEDRNEVKGILQPDYAALAR